VRGFSFSSSAEYDISFFSTRCESSLVLTIRARVDAQWEKPRAGGKLFRGFSFVARPRLYFQAQSFDEEQFPIASSCCAEDRRLPPPHPTAYP